MDVCKLKKGVYGALKAIILFQKLLSNTLQKWGRKINDYD